VDKALQTDKQNKGRK